MRGPRVWRRAFSQAEEVSPYNEALDNIRAIAFLNIQARKEVLKIARCQRSVRTNPYLRSRLQTCKETYTCPQDI